MIVETDILEKAHAHVEQQLFTAGVTPVATGYDLQHTRALVATAEEIGQSLFLPESDRRTLLLAAWLHDLCYMPLGAVPDESSFAPVTDFLLSSGVSERERSRILQAITATFYPQRPTDSVEEALCDAVSSFMASPDYFPSAEKQAQDQSGENWNLQDWLLKQKELFKQHAFFTRYAQQAYQEGKEKNRKLLKKKLATVGKDEVELDTLWKENQKLKKDLQKEKEQKAIKGTETMFRTTLASHVQLSVMADSKANLMISINAIIASIMISSVIRKFEEVPHLIIPSILLTLVCVTTIIFAVLSTRPKVKPSASPEDKVDLLFFGDFVRLSQESYKSSMRGMMRDHDKLYDSMIDNIYHQGQTLARKYTLLKIAYTVFMVGFAVVLLSYAIAWIFFEH
ncbi:hypothetical protein CLV24_104114 [Pontibacter ummariensis]|uniref:Pycsar effector protein domain-containing protein n=1 Tax=Pontibacter ummariensis TaxID=1610492 RepID=A0A239D984_9BACT|nr:Pycsar system effector family protein [Pontibacter ummariensis]PRY14304.1 hypothetical protein CLV24_104114 [Pontibacter ummariensis]SNS28692.1 hypothetical protein SAMN06296052_104113 [Pontibacter ummariensis]